MQRAVPARRGPARPAGRACRRAASRAAARLGQQHQRQQPRHLAVVGQQRARHPGQADRLARELAPLQLLAGRRRVALVEDQVEHLQHDARAARRARRRGGSSKRPPVGDRGLGPADPLRHRRLGHQERRGDLARWSARRPPAASARAATAATAPDGSTGTAASACRRRRRRRRRARRLLRRTRSPRAGSAPPRRAARRSAGGWRPRSASRADCPARPRPATAARRRSAPPGASSARSKSPVAPGDGGEDLRRELPQQRFVHTSTLPRRVRLGGRRSGLAVRLAIRDDGSRRGRPTPLAKRR